MICMENACANCGATYSRPPSWIGSYCSKVCAYKARTKDRTTVRRNVYRPGHPLAGRTGLLSCARATLFDKIGRGLHPCHWCGKPVNWAVGQRGQPADTLVADHLNADPLDDRPENLVAACGTCNGTRARAVGDDEPFINRPNGTRLRAVIVTCAHCHTQFLAIQAQVANGKARFCSRSCARRHPHRT